ncbi:hypothetical protein [Oscillatoria sp. FACHB-1406]|uniref:hypothetical protein n=1 Tax=Oscillatoria sp. FACHB-1406 TaxID=2692846 RepID=UPI001684FDBB|nr:hypothetical protein [Oscillatoria sp. FACHB-1406]MBD2578239.1 hypothetical protein [Oscillatoria sp. FACHB-1406]
MAKIKQRAIASLMILLGTVSVFLGSCSKDSSLSEPNNPSRAEKENVSLTERENSSSSEKETLKSPETEKSSSPQKENVKSSEKEAAKNDSSYPSLGTITQLQSGDLMCYATVADDNNKTYNLGATFEVCEGASELLNKKARLTYQETRVNDCQSNEPCGKTRLENLISEVKIVGSADSGDSAQQDTTILSNGKWRLEIGNMKSWDGTNGTGSVSYRGCDNKNNCIDLTGGKVTCREGVCRTIWQNGEYSYVVEQFITDGEAKPANLIVRQGDRVILRETEFRS